MKFLDTLEKKLTKFLDPISARVSGSKILRAISQGCVATVPITIGIALVTILVNLPFEGYKAFLESTGLYACGQEAVNVTLSLLSVYLICTVSYSYCKDNGYNNIIGTVLSLAVFLILVPSTISTGEDTTITALSSDYLGSQGIFVALILGVFVSSCYCKLMNSKLKIKLPSSIPPMVADSLSACIPAIVIITGAFLVKCAFNATPFGNLFSAFNTLLQQPIMALGTSPISFIIFTAFCNLLWFCGIHPAAITGIYTPIIVGAIVANIEAFVAGSPLPYAEIMVVYLICSLGGYGGTLGFCISTLFAKSEKYKATRGLYIVPNIFNINEPIIFGVPLMMNPIYFIPMIFSQVIGGLVAYGIYAVLPFAINPSYQLGFPWVTPPVITAFAEGGIIFFIIALIAIAIDFIMYFPFFLIDDKKALKAEESELSND